MKSEKFHIFACYLSCAIGLLSLHIHNYEKFNPISLICNYKLDRSRLNRRMTTNYRFAYVNKTIVIVKIDTSRAVKTLFLYHLNYCRSPYQLDYWWSYSGINYFVGRLDNRTRIAIFVLA